MVGGTGGLLRLAGPQLSSGFLERTCLKGIGQSETVQHAQCTRPPHCMVCRLSTPVLPLPPTHARNLHTCFSLNMCEMKKTRHSPMSHDLHNIA